jgi:hypothetical protein
MLSCDDESTRSLIGEPRPWVAEGVVSDAASETALEGVEISIKGTKIGVSKEDGEFHVVLGYTDENRTLRFEHQGYDTVEFETDTAVLVIERLYRIDVAMRPDQD